MFSDPSALTPRQAIELQKELQKQNILKKLEKEPVLVAGADISYNKYSKVIFATIIVFKLVDAAEVCRASIVTESNFPYIPGLLSFREVPPLLQVWEKLSLKPDLVILDGQGIAHPRRFGVASHFGLLTNTPTIGCAKSLLIGSFENLGHEAGSLSILSDKGEKVGYALRTKKGVKPVFISPGYGIDQEDSLKVIQRCIGNYRIPEPTRKAHLQ